MRAKNREINIFNMSLLDILTGALGAFMFMMLSFVPYYNIVVQQKLNQQNGQNQSQSSSGASQKDQEEELRRTKAELEELKKRNAELEKRIDDLLEKLKLAGRGDVTTEELAKVQEEVTRLQRELDQARQEIARLQAELARVQEELERLQKQLATLTAENERLQVENQTLRKENATLKARLEELEQKISDLERKLQGCQPVNPKEREKMREVYLELAFQHRRVNVIGTVEGPGSVEFLIRDPKGAWYDGATDRQWYGKRALRTVIFTDDKFAHGLSPREKGITRNGMMQALGFLLPGDYLIAARWVPATSAARPAPSPSPASQTSWLAPADAVAQSLDGAFGRSGTIPSPKPSPGAPPLERYPLRGSVQVSSLLGEDVSEMPPQLIPGDGSVTLLAKVQAAGPELFFRWYVPDPANSGDFMKTSGKRFDIADGEESRRAREAFQQQKVDPLKPEQCTIGGDCKRDARGDIKREEIDPANGFAAILKAEMSQ